MMIDCVEKRRRSLSWCDGAGKEECVCCLLAMGRAGHLPESYTGDALLHEDGETRGYDHFCPATAANDPPLSSFPHTYTFSLGIAGSWFVLTHGLTGSRAVLFQPP